MTDYYVASPEMGEKVVVKCDRHWTLEPLGPWNDRNPRRYKNYMAVVTKKSNGEFCYQWLKESTENDEWFKISDVKQGDILMVGVKDYRKPQHSEKVYYKVLERTEEKMVLVGETTYRKALIIGEE